MQKMRGPSNRRPAHVPRRQQLTEKKTMEGLMGAAKEAMGGGEAPPYDPAEAEAAINAEADKAGAAGNSDLMAKLKAAATNKKIQGAFMDVKNNGVSAAMKYKDDAELVATSQ